MRRLLCLLLCVSLCSSIAMPVKAATDDYLNITLADIIIAWYNASGVAIGDTQLANAIYDTYGSITIDDLVEHDCLFAMDAVYPPNSPESRDYVRELIGYGNLTVPMIAVDVHELQEYLSGFPISDVARKSLEAMFGWEGNFYNEVMFSLLGMAIGSVANIGKIAYQLAVDTLEDVSETVKNSYMGKTLLDIYRHFTDTTYFRDLLEEEHSSPGSGSGPVWDYTFDSGFPAERGAFVNPAGTQAIVGCGFGENVFSVSWKPPGEANRILYCCNLTDSLVGFTYAVSNVRDNVIKLSRAYGIRVNPNSLGSTYTGFGENFTPNGYAVVVPDGYDYDSALQYCRENNPWGVSETVTGITKYINNAVGNILSDNYINLSPNIGNNEYMYIFDRPVYIETLNQITDNTDNGDYSSNTTVINNFNETYIEEPSYIEVRPSTAPADPEQPAQPFISPRPTQAPEDYEGIIYEGGISEEITKKFPFCIPWDIKAMIDRLWTPESRAPYIHWDATFGSWGKLGEVDIDLQDFNGVASIFRSTTLLLWIVWLVIITRDLLG